MSNNVENKSGWKKLSYFFIVGFIVGILVVVIVQNIKESVGENGDDKDSKGEMILGDISVSVENQNAGGTVEVSAVTVPTISWIAVRENNYDVMGRILGARKIQAGTENDVVIELLRPTTAYVMYAIVFYEDDGDGVFNHESDKPMVNKEGSEIFARFSAN